MILLLAQSTILVTGASGFIGFHVCKRLLEQGEKVVGVDNNNDYYDPAIKKQRLAILNKEKNFSFIESDVADNASISKVFDTHNFDYVINLAGEAGVRDSFNHPEKHLRSNIIGFFNIIDNVRNHKSIKNTVYASTSAVYGDNPTPFKETQDITKPVSMYGASKACNEIIAYSYHKMYQLPTVGFRFFTVYGPYYRPDMAIYKFVKGINDGSPIDVYNNGENYRDFVYVDDVVDAVVKAMKRPDLSPNVYNIGSDISIKTLDLIKLIEKALGKKAKLNLMPSQVGDPVKTEVDITKAKNDFGFVPKVKIEEGIEKYIAWFLEANSYKKCN